MFIFYQFQWAKQVLCIEQNVPVKERLKSQGKYASTLEDGKKVFIVRWKITVIKFFSLKYFCIKMGKVLNQRKQGISTKTEFSGLRM